MVCNYLSNLFSTPCGFEVFEVRIDVTTSTVKKSTPASTAIFAAMKSFQVVFWLRLGAGAMP
jgi:hypothetical protein